MHSAPSLGAEILQQKDAIFFISFFLFFFFSKESIFQYFELCVQCYEMKILNNIFMAFSHGGLCVSALMSVRGEEGAPQETTETWSRCSLPLASVPAQSCACKPSGC